MRGSIVALLLVLSQICFWESSCPALWSQSSERTPAIYDPNPAHLWNRLHSTIFVRSDIPSTADVPDALDPPLWGNSKYLLAQPSHENVIRILGEFLQTHGERLIQDSAKHAMLQRELSAVFDWSVEREPDRPREPAYEKEKQELQIRLVEVMRRLALSPAEIRALPSNYALAVASGQFAKEYNTQHPECPFLPPDLFDPRGPWVGISGNGPSCEPAAAAHSHAFSRSTFLVLMRLPAGRKATFSYLQTSYLQTLWNFPRPWIERADDPRHEQTIENPDLPQFPDGTQVALVRQMMLFDNQGSIASTPITESIQLRVYSDIAGKDRVNGESASSMLEAVQNSGQNFYQFRLSRPLLFANKAGGLRATERDEREFAMLSAFGPDEGSPAQHIPLSAYPPVLQLCVECHRGAGINSLNSRGALLKPNWLQHDWSVGNYPAEHPWWEVGTRGGSRNDTSGAC